MLDNADRRNDKRFDAERLSLNHLRRQMTINSEATPTSHHFTSHNSFVFVMWPTKTLHANNGRISAIRLLVTMGVDPQKKSRGDPSFFPLRTSKHRMMKLGGRCIVEKSRPSSNFFPLTPFPSPPLRSRPLKSS